MKTTSRSTNPQSKYPLNNYPKNNYPHKEIIIDFSVVFDGKGYARERFSGKV